LFRLFNYPEHASHARDETSYGVGEHTDYGVLTILKQDDSGGLQVKSPSHGCWIAAPPLENTFVVNIGDMLERLTGGRFQSTPHRVRNLAPRDRISAPFFFDPSWHSRVTPLPLDHLPPATNVSDSRKTRWDKSSVFDFEGQQGEGNGEQRHWGLLRGQSKPRYRQLNLCFVLVVVCRSFRHVR
jgi:isopenicillin N synthase-like dioxygenase